MVFRLHNHSGHREDAIISVKPQAVWAEDTRFPRCLRRLCVTQFLCPLKENSWLLYYSFSLTKASCNLKIIPPCFSQCQFQFHIGCANVCGINSSGALAYGYEQPLWIWNYEATPFHETFKSFLILLKRELIDNNAFLWAQFRKKGLGSTSFK